MCSRGVWFGFVSILTAGRPKLDADGSLGGPRTWRRSSNRGEYRRKGRLKQDAGSFCDCERWPGQVGTKRMTSRTLSALPSLCKQDYITGQLDGRLLYQDGFRFRTASYVRTTRPSSEAPLRVPQQQRGVRIGWPGTVSVGASATRRRGQSPEQSMMSRGIRSHGLSESALEEGEGRREGDIFARNGIYTYVRRRFAAMERIG